MMSNEPEHDLYETDASYVEAWEQWAMMQKPVGIRQANGLIQIIDPLGLIDAVNAGRITLPGIDQ